MSTYRKTGRVLETEQNQIGVGSLLTACYSVSLKIRLVCTGMSLFNRKSVVAT